MLEYSTEEKREIISSLKALAVAQAEFWDVLREIGHSHGAEIETDPSLISVLGGECGHPPSFDDLEYKFGRRF